MLSEHRVELLDELPSVGGPAQPEAAAATSMMSSSAASTGMKPTSMSRCVAPLAAPTPKPPAAPRFSAPLVRQQPAGLSTHLNAPSASSVSLPDHPPITGYSENVSVQAPRRVPAQGLLKRRGISAPPLRTPKELLAMLGCSGGVGAAPASAPASAPCATAVTHGMAAVAHGTTAVTLYRVCPVDSCTVCDSCHTLLLTTLTTLTTAYYHYYSDYAYYYLSHVAYSCHTRYDSGAPAASGPKSRGRLHSAAARRSDSRSARWCTTCFAGQTRCVALPCRAVPACIVVTGT